MGKSAVPFCPKWCFGGFKRQSPAVAGDFSQKGKGVLRPPGMTPAAGLAHAAGPKEYKWGDYDRMPDPSAVLNAVVAGVLLGGFYAAVALGIAIAFV